MTRRWPVLATLLAAAALCSCSRAGSAKSEPRYDLSVAPVHGVGRVLVNAKGMTLYLYVPDRQKASHCTGFCATQWPPVLAPSAGRLVLGPGVDGSLVGSVRRSDGALQLTYDKWPLYTYSLDTPGNPAGAGVDMGLWQPMAPNGHGVP